MGLHFWCGLSNECDRKEANTACQIVGLFSTHMKAWPASLSSAESLIVPPHTLTMLCVPTRGKFGRKFSSVCLWSHVPYAASNCVVRPNLMPGREFLSTRWRPSFRGPAPPAARRKFRSTCSRVMKFPDTVSHARPWPAHQKKNEHAAPTLRGVVRPPAIMRQRHLRPTLSSYNTDTVWCSIACAFFTPSLADDCS